MDNSEKLSLFKQGQSGPGFVDVSTQVTPLSLNKQTIANLNGSASSMVTTNPACTNAAFAMCANSITFDPCAFNCNNNNPSVQVHCPITPNCPPPPTNLCVSHLHCGASHNHCGTVTVPLTIPPHCVTNGY